VVKEKEEAIATEGGSHTLLYVWIVDRGWDKRRNDGEEMEGLGKRESGKEKQSNERKGKDEKQRTRRPDKLGRWVQQQED
jgi:hypothetical protein